jgi:thioredoxin-related protein
MRLLFERTCCLGCAKMKKYCIHEQMFTETYIMNSYKFTLHLYGSSNTVRYEAALEPLLAKVSDLLRSYAVYSHKGRDYVSSHMELLQVGFGV